MAYTIEISINLIKYTNSSDIQSTLYYIADKYNYDKYYSISEMDGISKIPRSHSIITISFIKNQIESIVNFINEIKKYKYYTIECIYEDDINTKLLYATNYYLKNIDKNSRQTYNLNKRTRSYSEEEIKMISLIKVF